jgi:Ribonuclease H2 non-catalytic subunit (Ylr154p-like)
LLLRRRPVWWLPTTTITRTQTTTSTTTTMFLRNYHHYYHYPTDATRIKIPPHHQQQQQQQQQQHQQQRGMARIRSNPTKKKGIIPRTTTEEEEEEDDDDDEDDEEENDTEEEEEEDTPHIVTTLVEGLLPNEPRYHYCTKLHIWVRAVPQLPYEYRMEFGFTTRSLESVGDIISIELNGIVKDGSSTKTKKKSIYYEEGDLFFAIKWEGVEKRDGSFYLVTGKNIWRCPIRGTVTLNEAYADRNWKVEPPDETTILAYIQCSREDYYAKVSQQHQSIKVIDKDKPITHKNKTHIDELDETNYNHRWVDLEGYETFMRDFNP